MGTNAQARSEIAVIGSTNHPSLVNMTNTNSNQGIIMPDRI